MKKGSVKDILVAIWFVVGFYFLLQPYIFDLYAPQIISPYLYNEYGKMLAPSIFDEYKSADMLRFSLISWSIATLLFVSGFIFKRYSRNRLVVK